MTKIYGNTTYGVLLVGEAPNKANFIDDAEGTTALEIPRLLSLSGLSLDAFRALFARVNLLDAWPGRNPEGGDVFPRGLALEGARKIKETPYNLGWVQTIVLLGRRVQDAFLDVKGKRPPDWFVKENKIFPSEHGTTHRIDVVTVPHPSGINPWWNESSNVKKASFFWEALKDSALSVLESDRIMNPEDTNPFLIKARDLIDGGGKDLSMIQRHYALFRVAEDANLDWRSLPMDWDRVKEDRPYNRERNPFKTTGLFSQ